MDSLATPAWPRHVDTVVSASNRATGGDAFRRLGLEVEFHSDAALALIAIGRREPALVVLPCDVAGILLDELVDAVAHGTSSPVVIAVEGDSAESAVRALEFGARGLVGLPLAAAELDAAIKRWNPAAGARHPAVALGTLAIDVDAHRVTLDGVDVHLSVRELALLRLLVRDADRVVGADDLALAVGQATSTSVRVMLGRIRRKLAATAPGSNVQIETVRGAGYRIAVR